MYFVFLKRDQLRESFGKADARFEQLLASMGQAGPSPDFRTFLGSQGLAIARTELCEGQRSILCKCGPKSICPEHRCMCNACHTSGTRSRLCKWRARTSEFVIASKRPRLDYLNMWRKVRNNKSLKHAPTYFELAASARLGACTLITSPRERCMLNAISSTRNILAPMCIIDVSQSIQRKVIRADGMVPNIGAGSSRIFVPYDCAFLTPCQCLALQGFDSDECKEIVRFLLEEDAYQLAGDAMCVPAIGSVLIAAGAALKGW